VDHRWLMIVKTLHYSCLIFYYISEGFQSCASLKDFIKMSTFKYAKRIVALLFLFVASTGDQSLISVLRKATFYMWALNVLTIIFLNIYLKLNFVVLVRKRTIPTELPQSVGEVSANFS
jgi:hypothetical protein